MEAAPVRVGWLLRMAAATGARAAEEVLPHAPARLVGAAELGGVPKVARQARHASRHEPVGRLGESEEARARRRLDSMAPRNCRLRTV